MDTELAEMKVMVARTDERTASMAKSISDIAVAMRSHEDRDREDFKAVHSRVNRVERKQNWMLGVGSAVVVLFTMAVTAAKFIFGVV